MSDNTLVAPDLRLGPREASPDPAPTSWRRKAMLEWIVVHSLAVAAALFFVLPFVFVSLTAVMSDQQALTKNLWPSTWEWHNIVTVWNTPGFLTWWRNTLVYATAGTALSLVSSIPVAYALARFRFRGRNLAMMVVISTMMLPPQVVIVPMYLLWARQLHLTGTLWPLIIPLAFGDAVLDLPAAPVLPDDPQGVRRRRQGRRLRRLPRAAQGGAADGEAGDRGGRAVPVLLVLERLLRTADLRQ